MNIYSRRFLKQTVFYSGDYIIKINKTNLEYGTSRLFSKNVTCYTNGREEKPLMDLHGRRHDYLRISLTERCNLRCQYCMPAEGVQLSNKTKLLNRTELMRLVGLFASLGVKKLRLTGGEPTVRSDLTDIIKEMSSTPGICTVAMTSNGVALTRRLPALQRAGLSALNISLDSLRGDRYERMARRQGLQKVLACIDLALQLEIHPLKINTVLMKGFNDDELGDFVQFTRDRNVEVRFIEFMPFTGNRWDDSKMVSESSALAALRQQHPDLRALSRASCDTATVWQVPGYRGRVGFISSMTQPFCSTCNRLRLTADGSLKVCLFGDAEVSLRDALRAGTADEDLAALVRAALRRKLPQHAAGKQRGWSRLAGARAIGFRRSRRASLAVGSSRGYCTLSHLDAEGRARMVDVGGKPVTSRSARAECFLEVNARLLRLLRTARVAKGDALTVAEVAGTMAAKRTADLVPMCHPLPLEVARVALHLPPERDDARGGRVRVVCETRATARTGVEMEALTGCAVAALALYDMCKSVDKRMVIGDLRVVQKSGGASGDWGSETDRDEKEPGPKLRAHDESPLRPAETYAPTNFMHF